MLPVSVLYSRKMAFSINNLNAVSEFKQQIKASNLVSGQLYKINKIQRVKTKYGDAVLVDLEPGVLFLPKRYCSVITEENLEEVNKKSLGIVYKGTQPTSYGISTPIYEIIEV